MADEPSLPAHTRLQPQGLAVRQQLQDFAILHVEGVGHQDDSFVEQLDDWRVRQGPLAEFGDGCLLACPRLEFFLHLLLRRDVDHYTPQLPYWTLGIAYRVHDILQPDDPPVGSQSPVLERMIQAFPGAFYTVSNAPLAILRMDVAYPEVRLRQPVLDRVPKNICGPLADKCELPGLGIRLPDDRMQPLHDIVKASLSLRGMSLCRLLTG